jgi:hypothetical protein
MLLPLLIWLVFYVRQLLRDPNGLLPLMLIALCLGLVLVASMKLHSKDKKKK